MLSAVIVLPSFVLLWLEEVDLQWLFLFLLLQTQPFVEFVQRPTFHSALHFLLILCNVSSRNLNTFAALRSKLFFDSQIAFTCLKCVGLLHISLLVCPSPLKSQLSISYSSNRSLAERLLIKMTN
jgi:hypothetical protein